MRFLRILIQSTVRVLESKNQCITHFLLNDDPKKKKTCISHSNITMPFACVTFWCQKIDLKAIRAC